MGLVFTNIIGALGTIGTGCGLSGIVSICSRGLGALFSGISVKSVNLTVLVVVALEVRLRRHSLQ